MLTNEEQQALIDASARVAVDGIDATARETLIYALLPHDKMRERWLGQGCNASFGPLLIEIRRKEREMARVDARMKRLREAADDVRVLGISIEDAASSHGVDEDDLWRVMHDMRPKTKAEKAKAAPKEEAPKAEPEPEPKKEPEPEPRQQGKRVYVDAGSFADWEEVDEIPSEIHSSYRRVSPWLALLEQFTQSNKKCIKKSFANDKEAKKAQANLSRFVHEREMPVKVSSRAQTVYILRVEEGKKK